jgi:hypothetical protein
MEGLVVDRLADGGRPRQPHARRRVGCGSRDDGSAEPQPGGLGQPALGAVDLPQLAAQAHLTAGDQMGGQRPLGGRRHDRQGHGQVGTGLGDPHAAGHRHVHLGAAEVELGVPVEHRQHLVEPPGVDALHRAPWRRGVARHHQRLHLDQQGPLAVEHRSHDRAGDARLAVGEEQRARVGNARQPALAHLEQAQLVRAAEPVLDGPQHAQRVVPLAVEGQHRVDQVLEHPGPGQAALLGHVPHQDHADAPGLGLADQALGTAPHLPDRPGRRRDVGVVHRLDGVDHDHVGCQRVDVGDHVGQ